MSTAQRTADMLVKGQARQTESNTQRQGVPVCRDLGAVEQGVNLAFVSVFLVVHSVGTGFERGETLTYFYRVLFFRGVLQQGV